MTDTCENFLIKTNLNTIKEQSTGVLLKKVFIKNSQNCQKNSCAGVTF